MQRKILTTNAKLRDSKSYNDQEMTELKNSLKEKEVESPKIKLADKIIGNKLWKDFTGELTITWEMSLCSKKSRKCSKR